MERNKEVTKFLMTTNESNVKFILIKNSINDSDEQEKIVEFGVDLGELVYFCDDMSKARIKHYPIIIFEFTEGFYTTRDIYINNTYNFQLEALNLDGKLQNNIIQSSNDSFSENLLNSISLTNTLSSNFMTTPKTPPAKFKKQDTFKGAKEPLLIPKREIKFSKMNEKYQEYEFFQKQINVIRNDKKEKIKLLNTKLNLTHEALKNCHKKFQITNNIDNMRKQIFNLQEKIIHYENTIQCIKNIINRKHLDLHISSSIFCLNRENYSEKIQSLDKSLKKVEKYKIMYNSFKNKKLIELTYIFFSRLCQKFYIVPPFFNQNYDNNNKALRYKYYDAHTKELSVMTGTLANLIGYLSKIFNIPLKYPLFINGSRSFIVKDKKE
jgi:hypothetical protein